MERGKFDEIGKSGENGKFGKNLPVVGENANYEMLSPFLPHLLFSSKSPLFKAFLLSSPLNFQQPFADFSLLCAFLDLITSVLLVL